MKFFVRTTKGLGNATVYARLRDASGQYWDFIGGVWDASETANTKLFLTEYPDGDDLESLYMASSTSLPTGGPFLEEAVDSTDDSVIAIDDYVMGELASVPGGNASWQEKLEYVFQYLAFKRTATSNLESMYKEDNATILGTAPLADDGTKFTKNKVE